MSILEFIKRLNSNHFNAFIRFNHYDSDFANKLSSSHREALSNEVQTVSFNGAVFQVKSIINELPSGVELQLSYMIIEGTSKATSLSIDFEMAQWSAENYVLMPACAYNGNRFESRRLAYSPKLLDPRDVGPDKPIIISDVPRLNINKGPSFIHDRSGAMASPSMGFYNKQASSTFWLFTQQENELGDLMYSVIENNERDKARLCITSPIVRELTKYRITDNQFVCDDKAADLIKGDVVTLRIKIFFDKANSLQDLFNNWFGYRNCIMPPAKHTPKVPFSATFPVQEKKFNSQNFVQNHGYYSVGMREMFLQDWQIGWTGGMISTYPLLFSGKEETKTNVLRNFKWLFKEGISPSGFFWDSGESKGDQFFWYGGDIRKPTTKNWHLIRKSSDALYYITKQFMLMDTMGIPVDNSWKEGLQTVANAFVRLWDKWGQFGDFVDSITGDIAVGGSTGGGVAPAGLILAGNYFNNKEYTRVALAAADSMYTKYVSQGISCGGVGDAMQNPDSESAYGLLESFAVIYEHTRDAKWLEKSENMAMQFATWIMPYNYRLPTDSLLGKLGVETQGTVFANTQNKHGAPGICTHSGVALLRLYRATGNITYLELLRDIVRHIPQMLSHPKHPIPGMKEGWITERVSTTDWLEGIGEIMYGSTWAETSLMLTTIEIPAIYIIPDKNFIFNLDFFETTLDKNQLKIQNLTDVDSEIRIYIEDSTKLKEKLAENFLYNATKAFVKGNESIIITL